MILQVPFGDASLSAVPRNFTNINYQNAILSDLALSHSGSDMCIIGPRGCGKTAVINRFATTFNYDVETISLYQV